MASNRRSVTSEDLKNEVLAKITQYKNNGFPEAERVHKLIMEANPDLCPRLWYGMPGYAKTKDSAVLCFFRKDALISFGYTEAVDVAAVNTDARPLLPSAWYVLELNTDAEHEISEIVRKVSR